MEGARIHREEMLRLLGFNNGIDGMDWKIGRMDWMDGWMDYLMTMLVLLMRISLFLGPRQASSVTEIVPPPGPNAVTASYFQNQSILMRVYILEYIE